MRLSRKHCDVDGCDYWNLGFHDLALHAQAGKTRRDTKYELFRRKLYEAGKTISSNTLFDKLKNHHDVDKGGLGRTLCGDRYVVAISTECVRGNCGGSNTTNWCHIAFANVD